MPVRAGKRQRQAGQAGRRAISSEYLEAKKNSLRLVFDFDIFKQKSK